VKVEDIQMIKIFRENFASLGPLPTGIIHILFQYLDKKILQKLDFLATGFNDQPR